MNYLIFRTDRIGDFLISAILVKSLIKTYPNAKITVIASEKNFSYIKDFKYIDEVFLLKNNFFDKIKLIFKLKKKKFDKIIIHDDKKRSKFITFFLKAESKIFVKKNNQYSHIKIIKDILKKTECDFHKDSLNILDDKFPKTFNSEKYIHFHFDEKWIHDDYIKKFINIEPTKNELIGFINSIVKKSNRNLIITTGLKSPKLLNEVLSKLTNSKIIYKNNLNFIDLEQVVAKSDLLISCHGAISHVAAARNIKQIDIIDKTYDYSRWTEHFRNYNFIYRDKFNKISDQILRIL